MPRSKKHKKRHRFSEEDEGIAKGGGENNLLKKRKAKAGDDTDKNSPVVSRKIDYKSPKNVPVISLATDVDSLMYPIPSSEFISKHIRQKAVHITCCEGQEDIHEKSRILELREHMFDLDAESILRETSSDSVFLWLRKRDQSLADKEDRIQSIEVSDIGTAIALHKTAGHATYCRAPPMVEQNLVSSMLRSTGMGCGQYDPTGESVVPLARGEVETFISVPGHITNWHFDFQENFTIQLSGIKRWTLQQGAFRDPLRGCTPHYAAPDAVESQLKAAHLFDRKFRFGHPTTGVNATGSVESVDIKPGDVFYFPAGMWHKVETVEPGVSINISLMANNYATVVTQALHHFLLQQPEWRAPILDNSASSVAQHLQSLLAQLPSHIAEFSRGEYVIPPVLRYPPKFEVATSGEENGEMGWQSVEQKMSSDCESSDTKDDDEEEESGDGQKDEDESDESEGMLGDEGTAADVVDVLDFNYPDEWQPGLELGVTYGFKRNPLALLHRSCEINGFYGLSPNGGNDEENDHGTFIYNFNWAGNEMHQSCARTVFRDIGSGFVSNIYERLEQDRAPQLVAEVTSENFEPLKFLVFHGYLVVI